MIFHHPLPLAKVPVSGSQVRPIEMLKAFKMLGYNVEEVIGYTKDRKKTISKIKNNIQKGVKYEFAYCENSTMPTQLANPNHIPVAPFMDFNFFQFLQKNNIPVGLFYRDIHWAFPFYQKKVNLIKASIAKLFYRYELKKYNKVLSKLYLPSYEMAKYIPIINPNLIDILPPGHKNVSYVKHKKQFSSKKENINFLYVGGLSDFYDISLFIKELKNFPHIYLTICTRELDWETIKNKYEPIPDNIKVIHKSYNGLSDLYESSDIALLFVKPQEYWEFAVPIKLLEYVGYRKPVLTTKGIWSSHFIESYQNGWSIPHTQEALYSFLKTLTLTKIEEKNKPCEICAIENSWLARAQKVINDLT